MLGVLLQKYKRTPHSCWEQQLTRTEQKMLKQALHGLGPQKSANKSYPNQNHEISPSTSE